MFPSDGEYAVNIADMAGHIWGNDMEFENAVVVTVDGKPIYETVVGGDEDQKLYDQVQNGVFEQINKRLKDIKFNATAGPHKVGVTFRRRTFAESDDQLQLFVPGGGQDRVFRVDSFEISGPYNADGLSSTPSRDKIFACHPSGAEDQQACAEKIIGALATRAYRRPLAESDLAELLEYYRDGVATGGFEEGIRSAVTGILASPYFLYRFEQPPGRREARRRLQDRRCHARLEAVVLPLEHDSRRRAARGRDARRARRREGLSSSRSSGCSRTRARTRSRRTSSSIGST